MKPQDNPPWVHALHKLRAKPWRWVVMVALALLTFSGVPWIKHKLIEGRCANACGTYMRGLPGARWVADFADGPGYSALLTCTNEAMVRQEGRDCWQARIDACTAACTTSKPPLFSPENRGSWR